MEKKEFNKKLGKKIKSLRILHGYNQEEIAKKFGVVRTSWVNIEMGRQSVSAYQLVKISEIFGMGMIQFVRLLNRGK